MNPFHREAREPVPAPHPWRIGARNLTAEGTPLLMGILNVTPDSFSDGGRHLDVPAATDQALRLVAEGAAIIDVGGESTRPGATPVPLIEELRRVIPVIESIAGRTSVPISIDTSKAAVAREALAAGAAIVNDISGLEFDPHMPGVCAKAGAAVICMHMQGTPETMQKNPQYANVVDDVCRYLACRLETLEQQGIPRERVAIDPGIGFGKTASHNVELLANIARLRGLGRPVCIGHSRKRFLKTLLGRELDERLFATVGVAVAVALQGVEMIRVHEIAPVRDALLACRAILAGDSAGLSEPPRSSDSRGSLLP